MYFELFCVLVKQNDLNLFIFVFVKKDMPWQEEGGRRWLFILRVCQSQIRDNVPLSFQHHLLPHTCGSHFWLTPLLTPLLHTIHSHFWLTPLLHTNGSHFWLTPLLHTNGSHLSFTLVAHTSASHFWLTLLAHTYHLVFAFVSLHFTLDWWRMSCWQRADRVALCSNKDPSQCIVAGLTISQFDLLIATTNLHNLYCSCSCSLPTNLAS